MKKTRKLIPAIAMLLISAVMMSTASFAWFSMNKTVTATGMQVNATADGSLIIGDTISITAENKTTVALATAATTLKPMDFVTNGKPSADGTAFTGYAYCNNPDKVDPTTGLASGSNTLYYTAIDASSSGYYIMDTVYLAASGAEISGQDITATVTFKNNRTADPAPTALDANQKSVTVVFHVANAATAADEAAFTDFQAASATAELTTKVVASDTAQAIEIADNVSIPLNVNGSTTSAIPVHILFYIDGGLTSGNNAIVNSDAGSIANLGIEIAFSIANHS